MNASTAKVLPPETLALAMAAGVALLVSGPASLALPFALQAALLVVAVVVLGLPHGALDSWIARRAGLYERPLGWIGFNLAYLGLALVLVAGWWLFPAVALIFFLSISAWHFAGDWRPALPAWQSLGAGVALLGLPAVFHPQAVSEIFSVLSGPNAPAVARGLQLVGLASMAVLGPIILLAAYNNERAVAIELALVAMLSFAAPPLVYFALYFCLLHSPRHLRATFRRAPVVERSAMIGQAVAYTLATLVLAGLGAAFFLPSGKLPEIAVQTLFISLAALTVPHMVLMLWIEQGACDEQAAG